MPKSEWTSPGWRKARLIKKIIDRIALEEHDEKIRLEIETKLSRLSEHDLGWLENRIELVALKARAPQSDDL